MTKKQMVKLKICCDMLKSARDRGIRPVVIDTWYSSLNNLKYIRSFGWKWVTGLRKNRKVNRNVILCDSNFAKIL